ncbi:hypothetical protein FACS1894140_6910 [Spirochaetia bacterium]|nr:hypothetical protein FACS1894140_6910 [Spirochaetia bacterium]
MSLKPGDEKRAFLYKYRNLIGATPTQIDVNTQKILENGELYFAKPSQFNDPFDSKIDYDTNADETQIRAYFTRVLPTFGRPLNDIDGIITRIKKGEIQLSDFAPHNPYADLANIFCLSLDEKNILLWSHYAKDHTGICIGFKIHIWGNSMNIQAKPGYANPIAGFSDNLLPVVHVDYSATKPSAYNHFIHDVDKLEPFFRQKSSHWAYEQEVRIILMNSFLRKNPVCVDTAEIGEIIFGIKTPDIQIDLVKDILKRYPDGGRNVKLYKCIEIKGEYALDKKLL